MVEENQDNRKSFVFNALLRLFKFGDLKEFVVSLAKGFEVERSQEKNRKVQEEQQELPRF